MNSACAGALSDLDRIRVWSVSDLHGLLRFARRLWVSDEPARFDDTDGLYRLSTGGCEGNERIVEALQEHPYFWRLCWVATRTGGHYEFRVPMIRNGKVLTIL